jgi:hypothetical protein
MVVRPREKARAGRRSVLLDLDREAAVGDRGRCDPHRAVDDDGAGARIDDHLGGRIARIHVDILDAAIKAVRDSAPAGAWIATAPPLMARAIGWPNSALIASATRPAV